MTKIVKVGLPFLAVVALLGTATVSMAQFHGYSAPEIDPSSGVSAMALLAAAVVMIQGWRKK